MPAVLGCVVCATECQCRGLLRAGLGEPRPRASCETGPRSAASSCSLLPGQAPALPPLPAASSQARPRLWPPLFVAPAASSQARPPLWPPLPAASPPLPGPCSAASLSSGSSPPPRPGLRLLMASVPLARVTLSCWAASPQTSRRLSGPPACRAGECHQAGPGGG